MSNLYIRVRTGFYTHRKTAKLRSLIGDDAFWVPPRIWAYAAENQPDGDMSGYGSEELAMLIGCAKHTTSIKGYLSECGFLDSDGKIHDWIEHNGYHKKFSDRATAAALARWGTKRKEPKEKELKRKEESGDKQCLGHACSISGYADLQNIKLRINLLFRRKDTHVWSYSEETALLQVLKQPDFVSQLEAIEGAFRRHEPYMSQTVSRLLENWNDNVDRAVNPQPGRPKDPKTQRDEKIWREIDRAIEKA